LQLDRFTRLALPGCLAGRYCAIAEFTIAGSLILLSL
jgi:hypothetical protein